MYLAKMFLGPGLRGLNNQPQVIIVFIVGNKKYPHGSREYGPQKGHKGVSTLYLAVAAPGAAQES